jgi:hypothetical protein
VESSAGAWHIIAFSVLVPLHNQSGYGAFVGSVFGHSFPWTPNKAISYLQQYHQMAAINGTGMDALDGLILLSTGTKIFSVTGFS